MSDVHELLQRYATKQASIDEVMRGLISHDGWYAPVVLASEAFQTNKFDQLCIWGQSSNVPPGKLWLFTKKEAGLACVEKGAPPGPYAGPLRGSVLFEHLPDGVEVNVNPGWPKELGWFMAGKALAFGRAWGKAIALEQAFTTGDDLGARLAAFPEMLLFVADNGGIATAVGAAGMKNPGLIFTAPDCREAAMKKFDGLAKLRPGSAKPEALFGNLAGLGVDGYILNVAGVGPTKVLDAKICQAIVEIIRGEAEVRRLEAEAKAFEE